jgi:hypothetical protein
MKVVKVAEGSRRPPEARAVAAHPVVLRKIAKVPRRRNRNNETFSRSPLNWKKRSMKRWSGLPKARELKTKNCFKER